MTFAGGLGVWFVIGFAIAFVMRATYKAAHTEGWLTLTFGFFGSFIGGMLGTSGYIHHDPSPLRVGGILGATLGAAFFTFLYHYTARKAI